MKEFKLALLQMKIAGGKKKENLLRAEKMITESAKNGADICLLPEAMNLGWTHPSALNDADTIPDGDTFTTLADSAIKNKLFICSGLVEKENNKIYNTAVLISPEGELLLRHRKINELEIGHGYYAQGDRLNIWECELGTIGLMICSDAFAEERVLSQALGYLGADVILSPSSWALPPDYDNKSKPCGKIWYDHYHPVAKKFAVWIAGVSNVGRIIAGPWQGYHCIGNSLVLDSGGNIKLEGPFGVNAESILYTTIKPVIRPARGTGWISYWQQKS